MDIVKRDGSIQNFDKKKIEDAVIKVFTGTNTICNKDLCKDISQEIETICLSYQTTPSVEMIQDLVEEQLMKHDYYSQAKAYILYRQKRMENRELMMKLVKDLQEEAILPVMQKIQKDFSAEVYDFKALRMKFLSFLKEDMSKDMRLRMLMKACVELISREAPKWEYIASRFLSWQLKQDVHARMARLGISSFYEKIAYCTKEGLYGDYILKQYAKEEIDELQSYLKDERDELFTYSGLELVMKRYLLISHNHEVLETPQEMFMGIAMHLAIKEQDRVYWAKQIYDILSMLKVTMATPTMSNARKPYHQLSSCFIDTVDDTLSNIYKSIDNFAQVSKHGGGMGMYFGKVRANGSDIRGFEGAAGGVIRWIKLVNDTATAVDQLGVRQGAVAVYLDAWHKDLPEFLNLRTNNGDDRMKAHDVFPSVCYPDLFWKMAKEDLNATWYFMCPHEILKVKGYALEDYYGEEWEQRYFDCVNDARISKREMILKDVVRLILKSAVETGTPFTFNRDHVNRMNPNNHCGIIYCSNLCTEIAQNMSPLQIEEPEIVEVNGETIVVNKNKPGDFVVCNLASLSLGNIDVNNRNELQQIISVVVRALDNVIDLNYYPVPYAKITNQKYRPIGLGVSGYHHMLVKNGMSFESDEHLQFVDQLFKDINYYTIQASMQLAKEKGMYELFKNSDWDNGSYFTKRNYIQEKWKNLEKEVHEHG